MGKITYLKDPAGHRYVSAEDIKIKLNGCWIYYKGEPYYVKTNADPDDYKILRLYKMVRGEFDGGVKVSVCDPEINQNVFPMGWFNSPSYEEAVYGVRIPMRRYKQGLTEESFQISVLRDKGFVITHAGSTQINELLLQKYPTIDEALKTLKRKTVVALSPDVALSSLGKDLRVFVHQVDIGLFHPETLTTEVDKPGYYSVVSEELQKAGVQ